jgi:hypothetical protein
MNDGLPSSSAPISDLEALWAQADEANTRSYRMCGRVLRLRCDSADYAARFAQTFCRLRCHPAIPSDPVSVITFLTRETGPGGWPALVDRESGRIRDFQREEVAPSQLFFYLAFVEKRMFPLLDHLILHGAALEHHDSVTAIVGRTFSGKSTLGLRLALEPGVRFLSDEFCPVRLADGLVEPFPRCLQLRSRTRALLAEKGAISVTTPGEPGGQLEIDPGSVRGLCLGRGGPICNILLLSGEGLTSTKNSLRVLDLEFVTPSVLADLQAIPGVTAVRILDEPIGFGTAVELDVQDDRHVARDVINVCRDRHRMELFGFLPPGACRPDFTCPPTLSAVPAMRGIIETVRHLANLAALEPRIGAGYPKLLDSLATRLGDVRFFSLKPGPLEETSSLIRRRVLECE